MPSIRILAPCGLLLLAHPLLPGLPARALTTVWYAVVAACVLAGVRAHRPPQPRPWHFAAAGMIGLTLSSAVGVVRAAGVGMPWPEAVDKLPNLAGMLAIVVALVALMRARRTGIDRDGAVDAATVLVAGGLVWWELAGQTADPLVTVNVMRFLIMVALVAVIARSGLLRDRRRPLSLTLAMSSVGIAVLTRGFYAVAPSGHPLGDRLVDPLELIAIGLIGVAALHPSIRDVERREGAVAGEMRLSALRIVMLCAALLANPVLVLLSQWRNGGGDLVLPLGVVTLTLIVLWRIGRLVADRERGRRRIEAQTSHHALVARVGSLALGRAGIDELLDAAASDVAATLEVERAAVHAFADGHVTVEGRSLDEDEQACLATLAAVLTAAVEQRRAQEAMRHRALHDALTGLPNRTLLLDRLEHALAASSRRQSQVAVLFVDLDRFKDVNDRLGHAAGDELLVGAAARMNQLLRPEDTLARFAGDEFVVVCQDVEPDAGAQIADRLVHALGRPFDLRAGAAHVGGSVGVVLAEPGEPAEALLSRADAEMYRAKRDGLGHSMAAYS